MNIRTTTTIIIFIIISYLIVYLIIFNIIEAHFREREKVFSEIKSFLKNILIKCLQMNSLKK